MVGLTQFLLVWFTTLVVHNAYLRDFPTLESARWNFLLNLYLYAVIYCFALQRGLFFLYLHLVCSAGFIEFLLFTKRKIHLFMYFFTVVLGLPDFNLDSLIIFLTCSLYPFLATSTSTRLILFFFFLDTGKWVLLLRICTFPVARSL